MGVVTPLLLISLLLHVAAASAGPPAARPPDFEALKQSFSEDGKTTTIKRVVITKGKTAETGEATTEGSDFADSNFSAEMNEDEPIKIKKLIRTTEKPTAKSTTEATPTVESTIATESTTKQHTSAPSSRRLEIRKIVQTTTASPPPGGSSLLVVRTNSSVRRPPVSTGRAPSSEEADQQRDRLRSQEQRARAHPQYGSEDENSVTDDGSFVTEEVAPIAVPPATEPATESTTKIALSSTTRKTSTPKQSTTENPTTFKSTTTEGATTAELSTTEMATTPKPNTTAAPSKADIEVLEKELMRFHEEPFKVGTNIVPLHLFFDQSMGVHRRRKLAMAKRLSGETATITPRHTLETVDTMVPAVMQPFVNTPLPRTDDFLVPQMEDKAHDEKTLDSFKFPPMPADSKPAQKSKLPEKTILPSLLEMPHLSSLSSFGSLAVPIHPNGVSQRIRSIRVDSAQPSLLSKSKLSGKMSKKRRRRLLRKKAVLGTANKPLDGITVPLAIKLTEKPVRGSAQLVRTNNHKAAEERFAQSLAGKETTTALIVDSLKKMKKVTKRLMKNRKNRMTRAKASSGGKTLLVVPIRPHDGEAKAVKVDGNTDEREAVVDRDFGRKTVDRDV